MSIELDLDKIVVDYDFNSRGMELTEIDVADLLTSFEELGQQSPIMVTRNLDLGSDKPYVLVAGFRRYTACKILRDRGLEKWKTVRAEVRTDADDPESRVLINLTENLVRKDLNIVQEARTIQQLYVLGWTYKRVAERLGKSLAWVSLRFALLRMPQFVSDAAAKGDITEAQIKELKKIHDGGDDERLLNALKLMVRNKQRSETSAPSAKVVDKYTRHTRESRIKLSVKQIIDVNVWLQTNGHAQVEGSITLALAFAAGTIQWDTFFEEIGISPSPDPHEVFGDVLI